MWCVWGLNCTLPLLYLWVGFLRSVCVWFWIVAVIQQIPKDKIHFLFLTLAWTLSLTEPSSHTQRLKRVQSSPSLQRALFGLKFQVILNLHLISSIYTTLRDLRIVWRFSSKMLKREVQNVTILTERETEISALKCSYTKVQINRIILNSQIWRPHQKKLQFSGSPSSLQHRELLLNSC